MKQQPRIRITAVNVHRLECHLEQRFGWSLNWTRRRTATLVEVMTDAGLTGWGDGGYGGELLRLHPELVIGRSPFEVEAIYDLLRSPSVHQQRTGANTAGGLDTALWDLIGQVLGEPVGRLLGRQYRDRVEPYLTALYRTDCEDLAKHLAAEAAEWKARGFRTLKMKIGYEPELDVRLVGAVREAVGEEIGLAVDANCAYDAGTATRLAQRLAPFHLLWWEEPIAADDLDGYRRLREKAPMPLAGGETLSLDALARDYVQTRLVDIVQPEVEIIGLTGARRLSWLCWLNHIRLIPHNWGTAVRTAAILHWVSTIPPLTEALQAPPALFEFDQTESPMRDDVLEERLAPGDDGRFAVPQLPGLGVRVNAEAVARRRTELIEIR